MEILSLAARYERITARIQEAAHKVGRSPDSIRWIAVTKHVDVARIEEVYDLGIRDFGENREQEARSKISALATRSPRWHFIGHLQTNKVKRVVGVFSLIHSVDSWKLAEALDREARSARLVQPVLIQVNTSGETSKFGMPPADAPVLVERVVKELVGLRVCGLMTMAPAVTDPEAARPCFRRLRELRDEIESRLARHDLLAVNGLRLEHLSMGMSQDFPVAIEEGATMIRVGSGLFGPLQTPTSPPNHPPDRT